MENEIMETVAEETTRVVEAAEELVEVAKKPNIGKGAAMFVAACAAGYGVYRGIKWLVERHKAKKDAYDAVEMEDIGKIDDLDDVE